MHTHTLLDCKRIFANGNHVANLSVVLVLTGSNTIDHSAQSKRTGVEHLNAGCRSEINLVFRNADTRASVTVTVAVAVGVCADIVERSQFFERLGISHHNTSATLARVAAVGRLLRHHDKFVAMYDAILRRAAKRLIFVLRLIHAVFHFAIVGNIVD